MCTRPMGNVNDVLVTGEPTSIIQEKKPSSETNHSRSMASTTMNEKAEPDFMSPNYDPKEIQKIVREGILLTGGAVAILLQVANPGVGQGVNEHSSFAYRPVDRLRTTMTYVYCMAFGTPAERKAVIDTVHRAHVPVHGATYDANDPELQLWVAATLYASGVDIYEKIFGKLDDATAEQTFREYAVLATSLRVPPEMWPADRKSFWEYWDRQIANIVVSPHAQKVANDLLRDNKGPLWLKMQLPFLRLMTAEWLPPRIRDAYGLKTSAPKRGIYRATIFFGRHIYPLIPLSIRQAPKTHYMKDMRKRMRSENMV